MEQTEQTESEHQGQDLQALFEHLLRWQASQSTDAELRMAVRSFLLQHLPSAELEKLDSGKLPEEVHQAVFNGRDDSLTRGFPRRKTGSVAACNSPRDRQSRSQAVLEVELLPEPLVALREDRDRYRFDLVSMYHSLDGVVRFLTWDYLSFPGSIVVGCLIAVGSLPFVLENPEFNKDQSSGFTLRSPSSLAVQHQTASPTSDVRVDDSGPFDAPTADDHFAGPATELSSGTEASDLAEIARIPVKISHVPTALSRRLPPAEASAAESFEVGSTVVKEERIAALSPDNGASTTTEGATTRQPFEREKEIDIDAVLAPILSNAFKNAARNAAPIGNIKSSVQQPSDLPPADDSAQPGDTSLDMHDRSTLRTTMAERSNRET